MTNNANIEPVSRHPDQKLKDQDVIDMHRVCAEGVTVNQLRKRFGVGKNTVLRILYGLSWKRLHPSNLVKPS
jgi:hypothetical protein